MTHSEHKRRILCVGAHPDDIEIGMGGTVRSLTSRGFPVRILDLTNGEPTPFGTPETRLREAGEAARILGADRRTMDLPNRFLMDTVENRKAVAAEIRDFRPDYVFAPYPVDAHPDHVAAGALIPAARFYAKLSKSDIPGEPCFPARVVFYFPVHLRIRVEASFITDISDFIDDKRRAMAAYKSQFERAGKTAYLDRVTDENRYWGFQIGTEAGEPFFQHEPVAITQWPNGYL